MANPAAFLKRGIKGKVPISEFRNICLGTVPNLLEADNKIFCISLEYSVKSGFNILRYITVRSFLAFVTGFVICIVISPSFINFIRKKQFVQTIRDDGPKTHLNKKDTPTMGGVIILIALIQGER